MDGMGLGLGLLLGGKGRRGQEREGSENGQQGNKVEVGGQCRVAGAPKRTGRPPCRAGRCKIE